MGWRWVPQKGHGTSGSIMGWRSGTPGKDMGPVEVLWEEMGPPPPDGGQTENMTSRRTTRAVKMTKITC